MHSKGECQDSAINRELIIHTRPTERLPEQLRDVGVSAVTVSSQYSCCDSQCPTDGVPRLQFSVPTTHTHYSNGRRRSIAHQSIHHHPDVSCKQQPHKPHVNHSRSSNGYNNWQEGVDFQFNHPIVSSLLCGVVYSFTKTLVTVTFDGIQASEI